MKRALRMWILCLSRLNWLSGCSQASYHLPIRFARNEIFNSQSSIGVRKFATHLARSMVPKSTGGRARLVHPFALH